MLKLRIGNRKGYSFRVKPGLKPEVLRRVGPNILEGELENFGQLAILRGRRPKYELFIIEPALTSGEIVSKELDGEENEFTEFFARGGFRVVEHLGGKKAQDAFKKFVPS
ncbi:MAG: hypothetical protein IIA14_07455 [SAR324 cluster bacterium]|nr:hypothetical protein [SAR324 cluster bacterium]